MRIGLVHAPLPGHLGPATRLGAAMLRRGHEVVAWAPEQFREQVLASGVRFAALPPRAEAAGEPSARGIDGHEDFRAPAAGAAAHAGANAAPIVEALRAERLDVLVHDFTLVVARVAADHLGIPRVCSYPMRPRPDPAARLAGPAPGGAGELLRVSRAVILRRWGVDVGGFDEAVLNPAPVNVAYSTPEIAGLRAGEGGWTLVGPLLADEDDGPATPLARPRVYASLGTLYGRAQVYRTILEALAGEDLELIVGLGGALPPAELGPVPGNASVHEHADARAALRGAALSITQGGTSSLHEALHAGVPVLCLPQGADQHGWAARARALGVGEALEAPTADGLRQAVRRLLANRAAGQRARELADHLRGFDGEAIAAQAIEGLAG